MMHTQASQGFVIKKIIPSGFASLTLPIEPRRGEMMCSYEYRPTKTTLILDLGAFYLFLSIS